jgi:4-alpha-glucanotransferase
MKYLAGENRLMGTAIPLASIKTRGGWRTGEFPDLVPFGKLCRKAGLTVLQLLPVNDTGGQSSPYFALSAFALHPLYLRVKDLPEAAKAPEAGAALDAFAAQATPGERFPYEEAVAVKDKALRMVFDASAKAIMADAKLAAFMAENPWVRTYALFKHLKESNNQKAWMDWATARDPDPAELATLWADPSTAQERLYHVWVQMHCANQFATAAEALATDGIVLLGDIPILMNVDSADVWADRRWFNLDMRAGAPPDMFSQLGQNWGFPTYNWQTLEQDGHSFWLNRIREADRYYSAFRIDHVLGFFRIWALHEREESGYLGRFMPGASLSREELHSNGFSDERIRWLSQPHIRGEQVRTAGGNLDKAASSLEQLGNEDLYLFGPDIHGEKDIRHLGLDSATENFLLHAWRDRVLLPVKDDFFVPTWRFRDASAWNSLSDHERHSLEGLVSGKQAEEQPIWEHHGRALLAMLAKASGMLPCAEDLGAVPPCVPKVMSELGVPGLRIPRWTRDWDSPGQPYITLSDYPELSVCTPSVHDTSTLRGWWENEGERQGFAAACCPEHQEKEKLDPQTARSVLSTLASSASRLFVLQLQDLLDLAETYRAADPARDRINVPGIVDGFNWTWRMGPDTETLLADTNWIRSIRAIAEKGQRI